MKRRNFLRTVLTLPIITALPTKLFAKEKTKINHDNIKIDGSFEEWGKSVAKEIDSLSFISCVECKNTDSWYLPDFERYLQAFTIIFTTKCGYQTHISFAKTEFDKNKQHPGALRKLVKVRFFDGLYSIKELQNGNNQNT